MLACVLGLDFQSVVFVPAGLVNHLREDLSMGRRIDDEFICDQSPRRLLLVFQCLPREALGRSAIPLLGHQDIDDVAVLIDRPPQVVESLLAISSQRSLC